MTQKRSQFLVLEQLLVLQIAFRHMMQNEQRRHPFVTDIICWHGQRNWGRLLGLSVRGAGCAASLWAALWALACFHHCNAVTNNSGIFLLQPKKIPELTNTRTVSVGIF